MRLSLPHRLRAATFVAAALLSACSTPSEKGGTTGTTPAPSDLALPGDDAASPPPADMGQLADEGTRPDAASCPATTDPVKAVFDGVDPARLTQLLKELTGFVPVTIDGAQVSLTDRYLPSSKQQWRRYFTQYFSSLGLTAHELAYATKHSIGETQGHNVEVVIPGKSPDSVIVIVHYDSIGPAGQETKNPGVDDDMTGMAALMEAARLLSDPCRQPAYTVRLVAADYEEQGNPGLEGARQYATYIKNLSTSQGFKLIAAQDYEQSGWNCAIDNSCGSTKGGTTFYVVSCSGKEDGSKYDFPALGDALAQVAASYSPLTVSRVCIAAHSDHYAMWEIGVPSVVTSESGNNPRFDQAGGDTFDRIDLAYYAQISRVAIAFTAKLAGVATP